MQHYAIIFVVPNATKVSAPNSTQLNSHKSRLRKLANVYIIFTPEKKCSMIINILVTHNACNLPASLFVFVPGLKDMCHAMFKIG